MKYGLLPGIILVLCCAISVTAQTPARKAWMGITGSFSGRGMYIESVNREGSAGALGIREGDTVLAVNGQLITAVQQLNAAAGDIRTGDPIIIKYKRNNKEYTAKGKAAMRPYETSPIADVLYDWVSAGECTLRTIVRKPKRGGKLPAVLLIPGYNCGSIENYNQGSYAKLIQSWLEHGFIVVTIEKSGLGDSYHCEPCSQADLVSDIRIFDAGYRYMERLPYADNRNLFIWGHSMGGVIAPEVAKMHQPRGVIVFATVFRPWSEFLLEMHRIQWPLDGKSYAETEKDIRVIQKVYYEFFRLKKSPAELYRNPEYKDMVVRELDYTTPENTNMWGRHWRFWQQIDSLDLASSWSAVNCPVLSIFGGADFIACSQLEHDLIAGTVNAAHPGNCTNIIIPDVDHLITQNADRKAAHDHFSDRAYRDTHFHQGFADTVNAWMERMVVR